MPLPADVRSSDRWTNVALVICGIFVSFLISEAGARLVGLRMHARNLVTKDPILGWRLRPGRGGWYLEEGSAYIQVNSAGLRDREHSVAKPPGTFRIAVLGDSQAEGLGAPADKAFGGVLERELLSCPALSGKTVETINFGVRGYGPTQEWMMLRDHAFRYDPDLVLLAFSIVNDVEDASPPCCREERIRPYLLYSNDGFRLDDSFRHARALQPWNIRLSNLWRDLRSRSYVWNATSVVLSRLWHRSELAADRQQEERRRAGYPSGANRIFLPAWNEEAHDAWRPVDGVLERMRDGSRSHGSDFWLVVISPEISVHPDPAFRKAFLERLGVNTLDDPERRLLELAARRRIPAIALREPMAAYAQSHKVHLHGFDGSGFGHWNEEGHRLAGQIIAARLCESIRAGGGEAP